MATSITDIDLDNRELQQVLKVVGESRRTLFLTGKAGTGKSTLLRYICATTEKKFVVLAPTGIAAINAGGVTLHSFFKLPFHPLLPNDSQYSPRNLKKTLKYSGEKIKLLRELELIIIDEISMVRADILDFIDKVLRTYTGNHREPFGGKQLLLVGDVYQLEPVVKADERELLRPHFRSPYFFDANVFREMQLVSIELRKVYRQKDSTFISILDRIRSANCLVSDLKLLNSRVGASLEGKENELAITLSARRDTVDFINTQHLKEIDADPVIIEGEISGEFPESSLPTPITLELKPGAQIIFVKNDQEHRWVNGTLGVISSINVAKREVSVICEDGEEYVVGRTVWSNVRYSFNEKEQKVEEEELGTYCQLPLRLAWAITVHKSQGLTFRNVKIDLSGGAFAGGQTYVALSRCMSIEGLSLQAPIRQADIFIRPEVVAFAKGFGNETVIKSALVSAQADTEYLEAIRSFDNGDMEACLDFFFKAIHKRYDIEKPLYRRYIRRKLGVVNQLQDRIADLHKEIDDYQETLRTLAAEYVLMGKDCEREHMPTAAIANYEKALRIYPEAYDAERRLKKLKNNIKKK